MRGKKQPGLAAEELIACHECDLLHVKKPIPGGSNACCVRCGAFLYKNVHNTIDKALALNLSAFILFVMVNLFPFLSLEIGGCVEENLFVSGALTLYRLGMGELGLLVFLTSFLFPFINISGMLYILFPLKLGYRPWKVGQVYRLLNALMPWTLTAVFMLGVLISVVKLLDLASVIPGISFYAFVGLMFLSAASHSNMDPSVIWPPVKGFSNESIGTGATASERKLISCRTCNLLVHMDRLDIYGHGHCPRCGSPLHQRKRNSMNRVWALILTALILYIPANVYPVMTVIRFGRGDPNTILSGVIHLIEGGMWALALIIFFASIVVPVLKLVVLSFLLISIRIKSAWRPRDRTFLFRITEGVGAWSMVDIYVVAILTGLVDLGALSTIKPGIGASFFGTVVVITMFAAQCFDPRLIWDHSERSK
ncbi:MAG: PqiA/YebS family transporter subunit [Deltaproteobacteria bacterium]|nr:PqiA/YebS family transporter subunit [Deltaproteobacteria bacterium]